MAHVIEPAASSRAKCRGCDQPIAKGELRLGEREPNPYGEGEMSIWYHLLCGAFKRPEVLIEALGSAETEVEGSAALQAIAARGVTHPRLPGADGAQRSPSGRARCKSCQEIIEKDAWRIPLVRFEMSRFQPSGNIHAHCAPEYFGTVYLIDRVAHFSPDLSQDELDDFQRETTRKAP